MEKLSNCEIILNIEMIDSFRGGNQELEIIFTTEEGERYRLFF